MSFFKKLLGNDKSKNKPYVDKDGIYFYFQCENCGSLVKVRAHKQNDLMREDGGFVWHKTVVDNKCFRRMQTVITLDAAYQVLNVELVGGRFLTATEYETLVQERAAAAEAAKQARAETEASQSIAAPTENDEVG